MDKRFTGSLDPKLAVDTMRLCHPYQRPASYQPFNASSSKRVGDPEDQSIGKEEQRYIVVSDESGISGTIQSLAFIAGPEAAIKRLNSVCRKSLEAQGTREIKWKEIDDARKRAAAEEVLIAFLDCPDSRAMVLTWDLKDRRHQVERRDNAANFHRMLFHGLRCVADWHGDVPWHWCPDQKTDLDDAEVVSFLNNTRGYHALEGQDCLFGTTRHHIRIESHRQRCSKEVPVIGLADLLAGAVRHSIEDFAGCCDERASAGGQGGLPFEDVEAIPTVKRAEKTKRQMVVRIQQECGRRRLGVSLSDPPRLATHRKGSKVWFWHYEPQSIHDRAPTKPRRR